MIGTFEQVFDAMFPYQQHDAHVETWRGAQWLRQQLTAADAGCLRAEQEADRIIAETRRGDRIVTDYTPKPIPTNRFNWSACWENDEPNDMGQMKEGHGSLEQEAIAELITMTEDQE